MLVEVCANSLQSALNAQKAGADRIEICSELAVGGVTPSYGLLKAIRQQIDIPVNVLIRPRSGDFTYSEAEFEIMKTDISMCVDLGFAGIVSGILKKDFSLDAKRTEALTTASQNLNFTFHRAFDWVVDPLETASHLNAMGIQTILSSGQAKSAVEGVELLTELQRQTGGTTIMPGGGIRPENIHIFKERNFKAVHLSGSRFVRTLPTSPEIHMNTPSFLRDDAILLSDFDSVRTVVEAVKNKPRNYMGPVK